MVYVRQSTPKQVLDNRESTDRQYQLAARAAALGWRPDRVLVIDDDLGLSGRTAADRPGFQRLLAEVGLNHVGLILGSETSRLARSCKDWYQLLELAAVFGVLIADHDGLYDPGQHADRMMLGLSGMMSEAELHVMRNRLDQGKRNKAARGELFLLGPDRLRARTLGRDDARSRRAGARLWSGGSSTLSPRGAASARCWCNSFADGIRLPIRARSGANRGQIEWREPVPATVYNILRHPIYAGAYCYGRSRSDPRRKVPGRPLSGRVRVPRDEWAVLLRRHAPGVHLLGSIRGQPGAAPAEPVLVRDLGSTASGIGAAGRGGQVRPLRLADVRVVPRSAGGPTIRLPPEQPAATRPTAVSQRLLADDRRGGESTTPGRVGPGGIGIEPVSGHRLADTRPINGTGTGNCRLERARYQTERAHRQYDAAEPENRLVARELERRWEEALRAEQRLQEEYARSRSGSPRELTDADRERIMALASDIPALWAIAGPADRQAILRHLVEGVEIEATEHSEATRLTIRWVGGGVSRHELVRPVHTYERLGEFPRLLERIRELMAAGQRSGLIATQLNAEGFRSPKGDQRFTADRIRQIVCRFGLRTRRSALPADAPKLEAARVVDDGSGRGVGHPDPDADGVV